MLSNNFKFITILILLLISEANEYVITIFITKRIGVYLLLVRVILKVICLINHLKITFV